MDIDTLMNKLKDKGLHKKEKLEVIEDQLFRFDQNLRMGKDIRSEQDEYSIQIDNTENSNFLTFKLELGKKVNSKDYNKNLVLFLSMMPEYLKGGEFKYKDVNHEELCNSPTGKICGIIAYHKNKFSSFVDVEGSWTHFADERVKNLSFYENVIKCMLEDDLFPFLLIYRVGSYPNVIPNMHVTDLISQYMHYFENKKGKDIMRVKATRVDDREESKGNIGKFLHLFIWFHFEFTNHALGDDTSSDNHDVSGQKITESYERRGVGRSLISEDKKKKKSHKKDVIKNRFCCF